MRCFIAFFAHESNSFSPIPTDLSSFEEIGLYKPAMGDPADHLPLLKGAIDFYREAQKRGHTAIVGTCALAQPSAPCRRKDYEYLRDTILSELKAAAPVDMVFLMMHGAMMAQGYDDCEGDMLARVRQILGPDIPVGVLLDLHGNITEAMIRNATALIPCKEYPHTDFADRAKELYDLIEQAAKGSISPVISFFRIPALGLFHTTHSPMREFVDTMMAQEQEEGILSVSLAHGFPWADFKDTGACMMVITDNQKDKGDKIAEKLGREFFALKEQAVPHTLTPQELIPALKNVKDGTVVIADMADNPGGGAGSDSTFILDALIRGGIKNALIGFLWDPVGLNIAFAAGKGATLPMRIGGKIGPFSGPPLDLEVTVKELRSQAGQPHISDGTWCNLGRTAILETHGIEIVLNEIRQQPFRPEAFIAAGADPWSKRVVVVKSSFHFYAGFADKAAEVLFVDSPGTLNGDATTRPYKHITRPIWPLDPVEL
ncbi:M81 family metallopeptidase [Luteithermobacter gelatinilyticus]|uniref:M81 family metallopeptidase n=1 Tax=Luteithermobacter gelatinilyticus TaxID=2582913 RepID=UPI001106B114|nr:M81 family metallopeptidase [Luteithermobacter gelatinilyticus]